MNTKSIIKYIRDLRVRIEKIENVIDASVDAADKALPPETVKYGAGADNADRPEKFDQSY